MLDCDEFAVAMFLIDHKLSGNDIPEVLPNRLVPPSKMQLVVRRIGRRGDRERREETNSTDNLSTAHDPSASYAGDSGYGREASYRGGSSDRREGSLERGGGGGRFDAGYSYSGSRGRRDDEHDDDGELSGYIDRQ